MIQLSDRAIIEISGSDRKKFLQGLITNDINKTSENNLIYACMLNAQGRFLYDFFIFEQSEKLLLDCYAPRRDEILQKFGFYKLRSQVTIKKNDELKVFSTLKKSQFNDPRNNALGFRLYAKEETATDTINSYHFIRITNKIPESEYDLTYEKSFIAEFNFDNLNAIDYNKGCYVGQEPTARIHHLGEVRKEIIYLKLPQQLEKNSEITCEDGKPALVLSSVFYDNEIHALALKKIK